MLSFVTAGFHLMVVGAWMLHVIGCLGSSSGSGLVPLSN